MVRITNNLEKKNEHNDKTVNVVTRIFGRFVGYVRLKISRCWSKSILMKVLHIIICIVKIM